MSQKRSRAAYEADLQAQQSPYVLYGTPLPPKDPSVRDDGSYVPVWKQEVRDEQGRKRLHGAFTGGFSAGYFNTVGSKEGWTPSSFVSSRSNRSKDAAPQQQKPEDFMDEEDLAEQEEARKIFTKDDFSGLGSTADDAARRGTVTDLFRPTGETMGTKLLQRMGWREGQGIGPKVRRKARGEEADADGDEETHLFAPDDTPIIILPPKHDHKGLGFEGEAKLVTAAAVKDYDNGDDDTMFPKSTMPKKSIGAKGGIGIGVLNDDGSDDDDPYSMGPRLSYNRELGGKDKSKKKKKKPQAENGVSGSANPLLGAQHVFASRRAALKHAFRKCRDGRLPPQGFVLASDDPLSTALDIDSRYAPPEIPAGWVSSKIPRSSSAGDATDSTAHKSTADLARASTHDPSSRAALLGEVRLPGKSVFSYLTPSARDKLANLTSNSTLPAAGSEKFASDQAGPEDLVPPLAASLAKAALGRGTAGFVPYADDPEKLSRYRAFLSYRSGVSEPPPPPSGGTPKQREEWTRELSEFAHAATIFKPMAGGMASRFTASTANTKYSSDAAPGDAGAAENPPPKKDAALEAARMGMFGPLTRSEQRFFPTRLLCKRFGVPAPVHAAGDESEARARKREEVATSSAGGRGTGDRGAAGGVAVPSSGNEPGPRAAGAATGVAASSYASRFSSAGYQVGSGDDSKIVEQLPARPGGLSSGGGGGGEPAASEHVDDAAASFSRRDGGLLSEERVAAMAREAGFDVPEAGGRDDDDDDRGNGAGGGGGGEEIDPERNDVLEADRPADELFRAVFGSDSEDE